MHQNHVGVGGTSRAVGLGAKSIIDRQTNLNFRILSFIVIVYYLYIIIVSLGFYVIFRGIVVLSLYYLIYI